MFALVSATVFAQLPPELELSDAWLGLVAPVNSASSKSATESMSPGIRKLSQPKMPLYHSRTFTLLRVMLDYSGKVIPRDDRGRAIPLRGEIVATVINGGVGLDKREYRQEVEILPQSHRVFEIPVFIMPGDKSIEVYLEQGGKRSIIAFPAINPQPTDWSLVLAITTPQFSHRHLNQAGKKGEYYPRRHVPITPDELSDYPQVYQSFDTIVIDGPVHGSIKPSHLQALVQWVRGGGRLVVCGGSNTGSLMQSPLAEFLPLQLDGTSDVAGVECREFSDLVIATGSAKRGAREYFNAAPGPLIIGGCEGAGEIVYLAFSLADLANRNWPGKTQLLQRILTPDTTLNAKSALTGEDWRVRRERDIEMSLSKYELLATPPLSYIAWHFILYIALLMVLAGLMIYYQRSSLLWAMVPVVSLLFAGLISRELWSDGVSGISLSTIAVLEGNAGRGHMQCNTHWFLNSSSHFNGDIVMPGRDFLPRPLLGKRQRTYKGNLDFDMQDDGMCIRNLKILPLSFRSFITSSHMRIGEGVQAELYLDKDRIKGVIKNHTGMALPHGWIWVEPCLLPLPPLAEDEKINIDLQYSNQNNNLDLKFLDAKDNLWESKRVRILSEALLKSEFAKAGNTGLPRTLEPRLYFAVSHKEPDIDKSFGSRYLAGLLFLSYRFPLAIERGSIPCQMKPWPNFKWDYGHPLRIGYTLQQIVFHCPTPPRHIDRAALQLKMAGNISPRKFHVAVWNTIENEWQGVHMRSGANVLSNIKGKRMIRKDGLNGQFRFWDAIDPINNTVLLRMRTDSPLVDLNAREMTLTLITPSDSYWRPGRE
jgi:hypothetical protein